MGFDLSEYEDVEERKAQFYLKYPEGSFQTVEIKEWWFGDQEFIAYTAAAFRSPDDPRPGHGVAWEPVPGQTPYTRNSELMNAETSAWGRAVRAVMTTKGKGGASRDEVRNRQGEPERSPQRGHSRPQKPKGALQAYLDQIDLLIAQTDVYADWDEVMLGIVGEPRKRTEITSGEARNVKSTLEAMANA